MTRRMTFYLILALAVIAFFSYMVYMPGRSFRGELPGLDADGADMARRLEAHVAALCSHPAGRNHLEKQGLAAARDYIKAGFEKSGYEVRLVEYDIGGDIFANLEVTRPGGARADEIVVVGAHYDAAAGSPGANDNASGVAALLELAARFRETQSARSLRLVAFVNEEPPHFMQHTMGSDVYARRAAAEKQNIVAMYSLETIGYFRDESNSQHYPPPLNLFYPDRGNFIAFVGNLRSRGLLTRSLRAFRAHAQFPSEGIAAPEFIPGVNWSDHWSFWKQGYPAVMITDTAPYRYPYYHSAGDTPDRVDYAKMVPLVRGIGSMLQEILGADQRR